jgi:rhodanese-related sulfurtransferase
VRALLALGLFAALLQGEEAVARIDVAELKKALDTKAVLLIDVRDGAAYAAGHIAGAVSIAERDLEKQAARLRAEKRPIVTYCA